ncbi:hypothetical protein HYALB_00005367 [Hymenoscyphus albidus]|uniref:Extracellular membrane protein CFEM domain-containing protein n=1 Tax=Hymenoscyphus albidus TaxID=595503 RepID=A0A9N9PRM0_9HELO|nr:hypothetical protein HYALB_00005367 [Hymenoscyphus albidus]
MRSFSVLVAFALAAVAAAQGCGGSDLTQNLCRLGCENHDGIRDFNCDAARCICNDGFIVAE